jgi:hypothetical protein
MLVDKIIIAPHPHKIDKAGRRWPRSNTSTRKKGSMTDISSAKRWISLAQIDSRSRAQKAAFLRSHGWRQIICVCAYARIGVG